MNNMNNSSTLTTDIASTSNPTRKRGRPKKEKASTASISTTTTTPSMATSSRKRGRPRKIQKSDDIPDFKKIAKIKEFIKKHVPSVTKDTEDNVSENSKKMAQELWEKVNNYEKKYLG
ncbi:hypothetical protein Glove_194g160 [Diversispora epigaea]|uniref:Uncharacterized protein n=1 Tax=Diversispora epigaea TaxID=1348612 RepID=A0A397IPJ2_9GLOM|nr:hypothetical protein Glove_194g160 [Diversispora epigaea]